MPPLRTMLVAALLALAAQNAGAATIAAQIGPAFVAAAPAGPLAAATEVQDAPGRRAGKGGATSGGGAFPPPGHGGTIPGHAYGAQDESGALYQAPTPAAAVAAAPVPPAMPLLAAGFALLGLLRLRRG